MRVLHKMQPTCWSKINILQIDTQRKLGREIWSQLAQPSYSSSFSSCTCSLKYHESSFCSSVNSWILPHQLLFLWFSLEQLPGPRHLALWSSVYGLAVMGGDWAILWHIQNAAYLLIEDKHIANWYAEETWPRSLAPGGPAFIQFLIILLYLLTEIP